MMVLFFLPFVNCFARLIERILPDRGPSLTRHLDKTVLQAPVVALEAAKRALRDTAAATFDVFVSKLAAPDATALKLKEHDIRDALQRLREFYPLIPYTEDGMPHERVVQMHALDHLIRLQSHLVFSAGAKSALGTPRVGKASVLLSDMLALAAQGLRTGSPGNWRELVQKSSMGLADMRRMERPLIIEATAGTDSSPEQALELLDTMRWLDRIGYHVWRICNYLGISNGLSSAVGHTLPEGRNGQSGDDGHDEQGAGGQADAMVSGDVV